MIVLLLGYAVGVDPSLLKEGQLILFYIPECKHNSPYILHMDQQTSQSHLLGHPTPQKINCYEHKQFCQAFKLQGYPVLGRLSTSGLIIEQLDLDSLQINEYTVEALFSRLPVNVVFSSKEDRQGFEIDNETVWVDIDGGVGKRLVKRFGVGYWKVEKGASGLQRTYLGRNPGNLTKPFLYHKSSKNELSYNTFSLKVVQSSIPAVIMFYDPDCKASLYSPTILAHLKQRFSKFAVFYLYNLLQDDLPYNVTVGRLPDLQLWKGGRGESMPGMVTRRSGEDWLMKRL